MKTKKRKKPCKEGLRSFKACVADEKKFCGRYVVRSPAQAASKAYTQHLKKHKSTKKVVIRVVETTKGSSKREFSYTASRKKLKQPKVFTGERSFTVTHENMIKANKSEKRKAKPAAKPKAPKKKKAKTDAKPKCTADKVKKCNKANKVCNRQTGRCKKKASSKK